MKIKTLKNLILGLDIKPSGTILEIGRDISEVDAQRLIGFGDTVELLPEVDEVIQSQTKIEQPVPQTETFVEGPKKEDPLKGKPKVAAPTYVSKTAMPVPKGKKNKK